MMEQDLPQVPAEGVRVKYVRVTNLGEAMFTDRHDGIPVRIKPGEHKNVTVEQAAHIFGWHVGADPMDMFRHVQRRQGWNTPKFLEVNPATNLTLAEMNFCKLKIEPVMYKLVEVPGEAEKPIAADPQPPALPDETPRPPRRVDVRA